MLAIPCGQIIHAVRNRQRDMKRVLCSRLRDDGRVNEPLGNRNGMVCISRSGRPSSKESLCWANSGSPAVASSRTMRDITNSKRCRPRHHSYVVLWCPATTTSRRGLVAK
jgi:hypothetical protein